MDSRKILIGVDFGGTKIEVAALDADGVPLVRRRAATPDRYERALAVVRDLVEAVEAETAVVSRIGVGGPGSFSPRTGLLRNSNTQYLNGRSFAADLERLLGKAVRYSNDANCLALSEAVDGAAAGARVVFAVIIGTGCGGGVVIDGRLLEGANGIGGEWGHNPLPWPTEAEVRESVHCWCGQRGCQETWISGTGLQRDFAAAAGIRASGEDIIAAARRGETLAVAAFERYTDRLARALASVANLIDPDVIVLGGGMSNVAELGERLPPLIRRHVFSDAWETSVVRAKWGDSSGVRGAARLWSAVDA
ncbi:MAG: ROK family protein [Gammaproteobacteria bacterium]|nr:ROK family protein [Gammaproteobacteria bacterium]